MTLYVCTLRPDNLFFTVFVLDSWNHLEPISKNHPYAQKNNPLSKKSALQKLKCTRIFGFCWTLQKCLSIFGIQPLTSNRTPAWPCTYYFEWKSSFCKFYGIGILSDFWALPKNLFIDFWFQPSTSKCTPAWPWRDDFD